MDDRKRVPMTEAYRIENQPYDIDTIPKPVHQSKTSRFLNRATALALIVIALGIAVFLNWSLQDTKVITVYNTPFPSRVVRDNPDISNGFVVLTTDYCKNQDIDGELRTSFVSNTREVFLPVTEELLKKGCHTGNITIPIPSGIPVDTYYVKFRITYDLNPLKQDIVNEFKSKPFEAGVAR